MSLSDEFNKRILNKSYLEGDFDFDDDPFGFGYTDEPVNETTLGSSLWDGFAKHFISSATAGLTELTPLETTEWSQKSSGEKVGAAFGEALGMFVPLGGLNKLSRWGFSTIGKQGSRRLAKNAIKKASGKVATKAFKESVEKGFNEAVFTKEGKRLLYDHELGGDIAKGLNDNLMESIETSIRSVIKKETKKDITDTEMADIMQVFKDGFNEGEHLNSMYSWVGNKLAPKLQKLGLSSGFAKNLARYSGDVAHDAVVLGLHGITHHALMSATKEDVEFRPGSNFAHSLLLSFAFPLVRLIPGGGERKMSEMWNIARADFKKTDYEKLVKEKNGAKDLFALMQYITGGSRPNILKKSGWKSLKDSKKIYHIDDFVGKNFDDPEVVEELVHVAKQIQNSVGRIDMLRAFGKDFVADTINIGTMSRMVIGAGVMNIDLFRNSMAGFRDLPPEELFTHMLIGAFMSRARGGWMHDPNSRTSDAKAAEINNYYKLMGHLGIDHSKVSEFLKIKDTQEFFMTYHAGAHYDPTAKDIVRIFKKYEDIVRTEGGLNPQSSDNPSDMIGQYSLLRHGVGFLEEGADYRKIDFTALKPEQRARFIEELEGVNFDSTKKLKDSSYTELMGRITKNQGESLKRIYTKFFDRLSRESSPGAGDQILVNKTGGDGILRHGGIEWQNETSAPSELHALINHLTTAGLAEQNDSYNKINLTDKDSPQVKRLTRILDEFRSEQNRIALGDEVLGYFNVGSLDENHFLRTIIESHKTTSRQRISDLMTGKITAENTADAQLRDAILKILTEDGNQIAINPENIIVVGDDNTAETVTDANLQNKIEGLALALFSGHHTTSNTAKGGEPLKISESDASDLIGAFESRGFGISPEYLGDRNILKFIKAQAISTLDISPNAIHVVELLQERGLIQIDLEKGKILYNDESAIRDLAKDVMDPSEAVRMYREILNLLPADTLEKVEGQIRYDLDSDQIVSIEGLEKIYRTIPEIYSNEVRKDVLEIVGNSETLKFFEKEALGYLDLLNENLKAGNYNEAFRNLENLKLIMPALNDTSKPKELEWDSLTESYIIKIHGRPEGRVPLDGIDYNPSNKKYSSKKDQAKAEADKIADDLLSKRVVVKSQYETILEGIAAARGSQQAIDLSLFEYSGGSGSVYEAIKSMIGSEKFASQEIEKLLISIATKGDDYKWAAVNDHSRLVDNLNLLLGNTMKKVPLNQLFEAYLKTGSYKSLLELQSGLDQVYAGRTQVNLLDQKSLLGAYENMIQNHSDTITATRLDIAAKYGFLDPLNQTAIKSHIIDFIKKGDLDRLKKEINPKILKKETNVDNDLFYLQYLITNTVERASIKLVEIIKKNQDGSLEPVMVRQITHGMDNPVFLTPAIKVLDKLESQGIQLIQIDKSSLQNGRNIGNISADENAKLVFEADGIYNVPNDKYLHKSIQEGGKLDPKDEILRRTFLDRDAKLRYVDVSLGNPLAFVETDKSIDALNKSFENLYNRTLKRYEKKYNKNQVDNFKKAWDPKNTIGIDQKLAFLYHLNLNQAGFDKLWSHEAISNFDGKGGHNELALKMIKYAKLAEGGSLKGMPEIRVLENLMRNIEKDPNSSISKNVQRSIKTIINDLKSPSEGGTGNGTTYAVVGDEMEGNPFLVRSLLLEQVNDKTTIQDDVLRAHQIERISDTNRFELTMDQSSMDGAIYIDRDMYNLFSTLLNSENNANGFKGSIARGAVDDNTYILYGKGLFIYDPKISLSMEKKGLRVLVTESAAKGLDGLALNGNEVSPHQFKTSNISSEITNIGDGNIIRGTLEGVGLRFGGHNSSNSPVPHPYSHFMPDTLVVGVREGWMRLSDNIDNLKEFSKSLRTLAKDEIALQIARFDQFGPAYEQTLPNFARDMFSFGFNTNNNVVRKAVLKLFENQTLPTLLKPKNPKFAYPFLIPDSSLRNPISLGVESSIVADKKSAIRLQLGEGIIGADASTQPVNKASELIFSIREGDVDWLIRYDSTQKGDKRFEMYTPLDEVYKTEDIKTTLKDKDGKDYNLNIGNGTVPAKISKFIQDLDKAIASGANMHTIKSTVSLEGVQRMIESNYSSKKYDLNKWNFALILNVERGPRKGISDFIPVRSKPRNALETNIGTTFKLNSYDSRANAQADWDGDKVRYTYSFPDHENVKFGWEFIKKAYRWSSNNEEYKVGDTSPRKMNPFQLSFNNAGELNHAGSNATRSLAKSKSQIIQDQYSTGRIISMQSALEWASLAGLKIDGLNINDNLGFGIEDMVNNGGIYRRFETANQSAADFINSIDKKIKDNIDGYMLRGEGETDPSLEGKVFDWEKSDIRNDIMTEIINVLRRPASIFNQVYSDAGGKTPTSHDIHSQYVEIRKFFKDPNTYLFRKLVRNNYNNNTKMNQIVNLFIDSKFYAKNTLDFKRQILKGYLTKPLKNVIKFDNYTKNKPGEIATELIQKSNIGYLMDEVVQSDMYKVDSVDLAWTYRGKPLAPLADIKRTAESFVDELTMYRVLGINTNELLNNETVIQATNMNKYIKNAQQASILHHILTDERTFLQDKLETQFGYSHSNNHLLNKTTDRLLAIDNAINYIESARSKHILENIGKDQTVKKVTFKKGGKISNNSNKQVVYYKVIGNPVDKDGKANFKSVDFNKPIIIPPRKKSEKSLKGTYIKLENPFIGHRISKDRALEGYTWHYMHNNIAAFTDEALFNTYKHNANTIARELRTSWGNAIKIFKNNRGFSDQFFKEHTLKKTMLLDNFFHVDDAAFDMDPSKFINPQFKIEGLNLKSSLIYYKVKMLLEPKLLTRHYSKGADLEMPFYASNEKMFENVFQWLHKNGHSDIGKMLAAEYNGIKDFLAGRNNEMTHELRPSALYTERYAIPEGVDKETFLNVMQGIITPDLKHVFRMRGWSLYPDKLMGRVDGEYDIRQIRDQFDKWEEHAYDKRHGNCRTI